MTGEHSAGLALLADDVDIVDPAPSLSVPPPAAHHLELPQVRLLARGDFGGPGAGEHELPNRLRTILEAGPLDATLASHPRLGDALIADIDALSARAYPASRVTTRQAERWIDHEARDIHHRALLVLYQQHMRLPHHGLSANQFHPLACRLMLALEAPWERDMLARAQTGHDLSPGGLPSNPDAFVRWYRSTAFGHPLYEHELFRYLACEADRTRIEWFLRMESAGEAAFDDLVALGQVGTRGEVKIEMARNYWDEMGNGKSHAVHTHLFHKLVDGLSFTPPEAEELPWQVLAGVNLMLWSCISRRNAFRAQGVLGAVELLAPQRCTRLVHGALRVGISKRIMSYYGAHAVIDVGHAEGWLDHVLRPQVEELSDARIGIAEGLVLRADASLDYFDWCLGRMQGPGARDQERGARS